MNRTLPLFAVLVLTACQAGTDYRPPAISVASTWRGPPADPITATDQWWRALHDPLVDALVAAALAQNLDVEQAMARIDQARAAVRAAGAAQYPGGAIDGTAARARQSTESGLGRLAGLAPGFERTQNQFDLSAGASWELDLAGGLRRGREAATHEFDAAKASAAAMRLSVAGEVADAYVQLRGLQQGLALAQRETAALEALAPLTRLRERAGEAARLDVAQAEAAAASGRSAAAPLRAGIDAQMSRLRVLLGGAAPPALSELEKAGAIPAPGPAEAGPPADLLRRRPDLVVAERQLAASHARIGAAMAEYYPRLSLSELVGLQSNRSSSLFTGAANVIQGVAGLRWRLFDFARIDAEVAQARGAEREALATYRGAVLRATEEVETQFTAMAQAQAQAVDIDRRIAAARRARAMTEMAWKAGEIGLIEVLRAERDLIAALSAAATTRAEAARRWIGFRRALGG